MRRFWLVLLCAALVAARPGAAATAAEERGIILRVRASLITIRELDGARVRFVVTRATVITLDRRRVRIRRLRPGDVAAVDHVGRLATAIRATRP
jgi:hypothetical protein